MKNVLFIVYYFPPMGGSGVQRPLKFVKYLREFGWNPIVLCPNPGAYHTFDDSLQEELDAMDVEVHRVAGNTIFHTGGQNQKHIEVPEFLAKILRWFSTFFYLPDNKKNWIEPGFEGGSKIIESMDIDVIFSSAPPYSNLIIAKKLKSKFGIPLVIDLRDDWLGTHLFQYPTRWHHRKMKKLEFETLTGADALVTVNKHIADNIESRIGKGAEVIGHGFDPEDFEDAKKLAASSTGKISFLYSGTFYPDSNPHNFLQAIKLILEEHPEWQNKIELQFQGRLNRQHWKWINKYGLTEIVTDFGYVDHTQAIKNLLKADILWLIVGQKRNPEIISLGKTSEYFATEKPILGLVPDGSAKELLNAYKNAYIANPANVSEIKSKIVELLIRFEENKLHAPSEEVIQAFNRKKLSQKLAHLFDQISS
jgi:glycosyltransferase involved in cell wall biosynthesis